MDFWKIAMRPGKPLMVGRRGNTTFIGMPGNPVASIVCSHLFLKPLIARLSGTVARHDIRDAVLGAQMAANDSREDYVRAGIRLDGNSLSPRPSPFRFVNAENTGRIGRTHRPTTLCTSRRSRRNLPNLDAETLKSPEILKIRRIFTLEYLSIIFPIAEHNWNM